MISKQRRQKPSEPSKQDVHGSTANNSPEREIGAQARTFGSIKRIEERHCVLSLVESRREQTTITPVRIAAPLVEWATGVELGIHDLLDCKPHMLASDNRMMTLCCNTPHLLCW